MKKFVILILLLLPYLLQYAQSIEGKREYLELIESSTAKIKKNPQNIEAYFNRGILYDAINNFTSANRDLSKAVALFSEHPNKKLNKIITRACYYLADDYFYRISDRTRAMQYVKKGLEIVPDDKSLQIMEVAILGSYKEKRTEARKKFEAFIEKYPKEEKLIYHYAKFLEKEDMERAVNYYKRVLDINPDNVDALFALGSYHTNKAHQEQVSSGDAGVILKNTIKGVEYFELVHELQPYDTEVIEILILFYGSLSRHEDIAEMKQKLQTLSK